MLNQFLDIKLNNVCKVKVEFTKMEQFSHDLTLALEETSKCSGVSRWSTRRRTRSTGNLPCAPQPTEDSSSPADGYNAGDGDGTVNPTFSDSDDRQEHKLSLKSRQACIFGNLESDSLNETFSPARPNTRRKRKFKRMAVEYETTPSTPGNTNPTPIFPIASAIKKRVFKHTSQENFKANLFFCGKRKRSHRDRYFEQHSSSVPRQRDLFAPKNSYSEYRSRNRSFSKPERILPLNKTIISKIEKISQDTKNKISGFQFLCLQDRDVNKPTIKEPINLFKSHPSNQQQTSEISTHKMAQKSGSFESTFSTSDDIQQQSGEKMNAVINNHINKKHYKNIKRIQMKLQLQFEDASLMDCGGLNEFLSSSSLSSSSDSEEVETNESDREGDDELTDWPGNEAMVNFTSKNDFKRAKPRLKATLPKSDELGQDDDTLMSTDEIGGTSQQQIPPPPPPTTLNLSVKYSPATSVNDVGVSTMTTPIDITGGAVGPLRNQIESEMSGETSNYFLSSPSRVEVREIRAGCRRIRNERRGFTILTSANEELSRFLQDARQERLTLPYTDAQEHEKLFHLAKLYSLVINIENGCAILTKTSNTTQSVKIDQTTITKRFLSDYKRRCYGGDYDDPESSGMAS